jgi:hypothetical protein
MTPWQRFLEIIRILLNAGYDDDTLVEVNQDYLDYEETEE